MPRLPLPDPRNDPVLAGALVLLALVGLTSVVSLPGEGAGAASSFAGLTGIGAILLAVAVRRPAESASTRTFWRLLAFGLAFYFAMQLWRVTAGVLSPPPVSRRADLLYLGRYLFLVMILELRPDSPRSGRSEEQLRLLDTAGAVLFLFALIAYVLVSPPFQEVTSGSALPKRGLYLVLDVFLVVRVLTLRVQSPSPYWRAIYSWLGAVFLLRGLNNLVYGAPGVGEAPLGWGPTNGPIWVLAMVPLVIAARLPSDLTHEDASVVQDAARARLAPLVGYAFMLPVFHFLMERVGIVEDESAGPRELVVLVFLGTAAFLLWVYQRVLLRDNQRLERERGLMAEQTAQASRLEAIGRLAGGVAHDFNNLLTVIRGRTELMLAEHQEDETLQEDLNAIRDATRRGEGVTRQLLAFGRRQMLRPEVLDLGAVVGEMAPLLRSAISDEVRLSIAVRDPAPLILADQGQVEMVLLNLAVNAREAMPDGGMLAVSVDDVELDAETAADIPDGRAGRYVLLTVQDTGKGMDEAVRSRIFEPFFTTKPFGSGAGLGLPAVHGFVRQSGGAVTVDSAPGRGATFRIYLPRMDAAAAAVAPGGAAAAPTNGRPGS